jgi:hypothetical protein
VGREAAEDGKKLTERSAGEGQSADPWAAGWPACLHRLVEEYGAEQVWECGLRVLGFPPTFVHTADEMRRVKAAIAS